MTQFAEDVKAYTRYAAEFDAPIRCELLYGDAHAAISRIAGKYRVALSFPRKFDVEVGLVRYSPVVNALQSYPRTGAGTQSRLFSTSPATSSEPIKRK